MTPLGDIRVLIAGGNDDTTHPPTRRRSCGYHPSPNRGRSSRPRFAVRSGHRDPRHDTGRNTDGPGGPGGPGGRQRPSPEGQDRPTALSGVPAGGRRRRAPTCELSGAALRDGFRSDRARRPSEDRSRPYQCRERSPRTYFAPPEASPRAGVYFTLTRRRPTWIPRFLTIRRQVELSRRPRSPGEESFVDGPPFDRGRRAGPALTDRPSQVLHPVNRTAPRITHAGAVSRRPSRIG